MKRTVVVHAIVLALGISASVEGQTSTNPVSLTYLGAAGWQISDGQTVILIDPYLTRIRRAVSSDSGSAAADLPGDARPIIGQDDPLVSDVATIDAHIKQADLILVTHSHFDHLMDVPHIARQTGAAVVGHQSAINVLRAHGIPSDKLLTVRGGEDYEFNGLSLKVIPNLHSQLNRKLYFDDRVIPPTISTPLRLRDLLVEGGSLCYLIRFGGYEILAFGSMNYIEWEMVGMRPDVALIGAGPSRVEIHDYAGRLMRALGFPGLVIPTHWDNYNVPYGASQQEPINQVAGFVNDVKVVSPKTRVVVPEYFKPIVLDRRPLVNAGR